MRSYCDDLYTHKRTGCLTSDLLQRRELFAFSLLHSSFDLHAQSLVRATALTRSKQVCVFRSGEVPTVLKLLLFCSQGLCRNAAALVRLGLVLALLSGLEIVR